MDILIPLLVILSPLWYALLIVSPLGRRAKVYVAVVSFAILVTLPVLLLVWGPSLGL